MKIYLKGTLNKSKGMHNYIRYNRCVFALSVITARTHSNTLFCSLSFYFKDIYIYIYISLISEFHLNCIKTRTKSCP